MATTLERITSYFKTPQGQQALSEIELPDQPDAEDRDRLVAELREEQRLDGEFCAEKRAKLAAGKAAYDHAKAEWEAAERAYRDVLFETSLPSDASRRAEVIERTLRTMLPPHVGEALERLDASIEEARRTPTPTLEGFPTKEARDAFVAEGNARQARYRTMFELSIELRDAVYTMTADELTRAIERIDAALGAGELVEA